MACQSYVILGNVFRGRLNGFEEYPVSFWDDPFWGGKRQFFDKFPLSMG